MMRTFDVGATFMERSAVGGHYVAYRLFALPDETLVICGHGPNTTIGEERKLNPFVGQR